MSEEWFSNNLEDIKVILSKGKLKIPYLETIMNFFKTINKNQKREFINFLKIAEKSSNRILKKNAIITVRYFFKKDKQFSKLIYDFKGKRIWKSKADGDLYFLFSFLFGILLVTVIFLFIYITYFLFITESSLVLPILSIITFMIDSPIFLYFTLIPIVPYLVIYENGVTVRSTLCYLSRTYHPFEYIKKIEILDTWHTIAYNKYKGSTHDPRGKIRITKRNGSYQELSIAWVTEIEKASEIIEGLMLSLSIKHLLGLKDRLSKEEYDKLLVLEKHPIIIKIMTIVWISAFGLLLSFIFLLIIGYNSLSSEVETLAEAGRKLVDLGWIFFIISVILWIIYGFYAVYYNKHKEKLQDKLRKFRLG
ncbi:MAG: hypothetical protein EAX96_14705 [Candidatus Lokiarchaeota archaeon]|nr:hypothetical protein [Candidatus Lokiarchaeota archaeon]